MTAETSAVRALTTAEGGLAGVLLRGYRGLLVGLEVFVVGIFTVLTLDVLWGVFSRHVMGHQSGFTEELAIYSLVWLSLLGAALTYAERGHLGVDYFVSKLDPEAQRISQVIVELLVMAFALVALVWGGALLVYETLQADQLSPALGIRVGYVYLAVPLSGVFFTLACIEHLSDARGQAGNRRA